MSAQNGHLNQSTATAQSTARQNQLGIGLQPSASQYIHASIPTMPIKTKKRRNSKKDLTLNTSVSKKRKVGGRKPSAEFKSINKVEQIDDNVIEKFQKAMQKDEMRRSANQGQFIL